MLKFLVLFLCSLTFLHAQNIENSANSQKVKLSKSVPARKSASLTSNIYIWIPKDSVVEVLDIKNEFLEVKYAQEYLFLPASQFEENDLKIYIEQRKIEEKNFLKQKEESDRAWEAYKIKNSIKTTTNKKSGNNTYQSGSSNRTSVKRNTGVRYSSKRYIRGPRGGCYYINSNGNKTYVDRSLCN